MIEFNTEIEDGFAVLSFEKDFNDEEGICVDIREKEDRVDGMIILKVPETDYPCDEDNYICGVLPECCPDKNEIIEACPVATTSLGMGACSMCSADDPIEMAHILKDMIVNNFDGIAHPLGVSASVQEFMSDTWIIKLPI